MKILTALLITISCGLFAWNAKAQNVDCYLYDQFMEPMQLTGRSVTAAGIDGNGNLVQVLTSETGMWLIVVRLEKGGTVYACPLSGGEGWQNVEPKRGRAS